MEPHRKGHTIINGMACRERTEERTFESLGRQNAEWCEGLPRNVHLKWGRGKLRGQNKLRKQRGLGDWEEIDP